LWVQENASALVEHTRRECATTLELLLGSGEAHLHRRCCTVWAVHRYSQYRLRSWMR